jgi:esterase/lipase superfamily enzyme
MATAASTTPKKDFSDFGVREMRRALCLITLLLLALAGCAGNADRATAPDDGFDAEAMPPDLDDPADWDPADEPASELPPDDMPFDMTPPDMTPPDRITGTEPPDLDFPSRFEIDPPRVRSPADRPVLDRGFTRVEILYATDRARGSDQPETFYTDRRRRDTDRTPFEFGTCEVSVPYKHRPGEIERPSVWRLEFREDPAKHVVLLAVKPMPVEDSLPALRARVAASESQSALVFVHGFNVPFAAAARRTAQMKYDLDFDGAVLLYSWPAPQNYLECQDNEIWTRAHLIELLKEYVQKSGAKQIHLVAHSMGTRVLSNALVELADSQGGADFRYNQIILAAPDIDADIFKQRIAPRIVDRADRISIYASSKDLALVASKKAHNNIRLGEGGPNITVFPGMSMIEVVDASNINESLLGHSYYGDSPTILRDLRLLLSGQDAPSRGLLAGKGFFLLQRK